jgi:hypothetical protein
LYLLAFRRLVLFGDAVITFFLGLAFLLHFSLTLLKRVRVLCHLNALYFVIRATLNRRLTAAECMPAFACFLAREGLRAAFWASFLPGLQVRLLGLTLRWFGLFCFCHSRRFKSYEPWLIRLLHGALRMHAAG